MNINVYFLSYWRRWKTRFSSIVPGLNKVVQDKSCELLENPKEINLETK